MDTGHNRIPSVLCNTYVVIQTLLFRFLSVVFPSAIVKRFVTGSKSWPISKSNYETREVKLKLIVIDVSSSDSEKSK